MKWTCNNFDLSGAMLIQDCENPNKMYLENGDIRYIFEEGKCVGWYHPELERVV